MTRPTSPAPDLAAKRLCALAELRKTASQAADIVADRYVGSIQRPPVMLDALCRDFNVTIEERTDLAIAGELRCEAGQLIVRHSAGAPPARVRFTIAHELAHLILDDAPRRKPLPRTAELERICNLLAAAILMPRHLFARAVDPPTIDRLSAAASEFAVSLESAARRCDDLGESSSFAMTDGVVIWRTRRINPRDPVIVSVIERAFAGETNIQNLLLTTPLWTGYWRGEAQTWEPRSGLFLFHPDPDALHRALRQRQRTSQHA
jgi:Zn-dependent peptidase ImmA (M78 family)